MRVPAVLARHFAILCALIALASCGRSEKGENAKLLNSLKGSIEHKIAQRPLGDDSIQLSYTQGVEVAAGELRLERAICTRAKSGQCKSSRRHWTVSRLSADLAALAPDEAEITPLGASSEARFSLTIPCTSGATCVTLGDHADPSAKAVCSGADCILRGQTESYAADPKAGSALVLECGTKRACEQAVATFKKLASRQSVRATPINETPAKAEPASAASGSKPQKPEDLVEALDGVSEDLKYPIDSHGSTERIDGIRLSGSALKIESTLDIQSDVMAIIAAETSIPLDEVTLSRDVQGGFVLSCTDGAACIGSDVDLRGIKEAKASNYVLRCDPPACPFVRETVETLLGLFQRSASGTLPAGGAATGSLVRQVNALIERIEYTEPDIDPNGNRVGTKHVSIRYETELEAHQLQVRVIAHAWTGAVTGERRDWGSVTASSQIPLAEAYVKPPANTNHLTEAGGRVFALALACQFGKHCTTMTTGGKARNANQFVFQCDEAKCAALGARLEQLIAASKMKPRTAQGPTELQRRMAGTVQRINAGIAHAAWGNTVTDGIEITGDGKIAVRTRDCAGATPCGENGARSIVEFDARDIDPNSIGLQSQGARWLLRFGCRSNEICIRSPDGRLQFGGYGLACPDPTACNRLVIEFTALLDRMPRSSQ